MNKFLTRILLTASLFSPVVLALPVGAATMPNWNTTGTYVVSFDGYNHDAFLTQDGLGNVTGNGGYLSGSPYTYAWTIATGTVSGNTINLTMDYTLGAVGTTMSMDGMIATSGSMSGTWEDNYGGGSRTGTWTTVSGSALALGTLNAEDFGVVNYDTGLGMLKGYSAGFGLTDATFASTTSVVVKLYSAGDVLLQTNTAILPKFNADITGVQISSPFDVSGTFDYATDGYWTNLREVQFGQSVPAVKVVATVTLENGKIVTAENTTLAGDPTTIYPVTVPTTVAVHIFKFIDGVQATTGPSSANGVDFPMFTSTYNAPFTLGPAGWTTGDVAYEASTGAMALGSSYSANENLTTALVGSDCNADQTYSLIGYGVGDTLLQAMQAVSTTTIPNLTNLQSDKYIVVNNHRCEVIVTPTTGHLVVQKTTNPSNDATIFSIIATGTGMITGGGAGTTTDATDKHYEVVAGTYSVTENPTIGWTMTSNTCTNVVVAVGATVNCLITNTKDVVVTTGSISGMKYNDLNRNGKKDSGEPGMAGWVIKLKKGNLKISTSTDANGNYTFSNLATGIYTVREVQQKGWKRTSKNPKAIAIATSTVVTDVNFGNAKKQRNEKEDSDNDNDDNEQEGNGGGHSNQSYHANEKSNKGHRN